MEKPTEMDNHIKDKYLKRIKFWFFSNYLTEAIAIVILLVSVFYDFFGIEWFDKHLPSIGIAGIVINIPTTIFFSRVPTVKKSLIVSIGRDSNNNLLLQTCDGTTTIITDLSKLFIGGLERDWDFSSFLGSRNGIGTMTKELLEGHVLYFGQKKFLLVSNIFELPLPFEINS